MKNLLSDLRKEFDYVLIDSPAGIDGGFKLATADSDRIIVVTTPQIAAIHDADCVIQLLHRKKVPRIDLLVNGYRRQMVRDGNMLDIPDICELLEAELLGVVLEDEEIIISQNHGEPVIGKHTVSDTCYQNIARRIAGMEVAIPDYLHHKRDVLQILLAESCRKAGVGCVIEARVLQKSG